MPKSTATCNSILALIFNSTAWADIAENDTSAPATNLYLSLHTASPSGDDQTSNEATYGGYARIAVSRNGTGGWDAPSGGATANAALAQFAECSSGSNVITHVAIGTASSGAGHILYSGALSASRTISSGIQPQFADSALTVTET